ncbi:Genetic suppressor element 1, partial [Ophiophagus hannah]
MIASHARFFPLWLGQEAGGVDGGWLLVLGGLPTCVHPTSHATASQGVTRGGGGGGGEMPEEKTLPQLVIILQPALISRKKVSAFSEPEPRGGCASFLKPWLGTVGLSQFLMSLPPGTHSHPASPCISEAGFGCEACPTPTRARRYDQHQQAARLRHWRISPSRFSIPQRCHYFLRPGEGGQGAGLASDGTGSHSRGPKEPHAALEPQKNKQKGEKERKMRERKGKRKRNEKMRERMIEEKEKQLREKGEREREMREGKEGEIKREGERGRERERERETPIGMAGVGHVTGWE